MTDSPVIILNWNGWDDTLCCIESILKTNQQVNVWVVDNGSDEDRSAEILTKFPNTRYIQLDQNFGWAGGYNRGLKFAIQEKFKFAYLLNNDTTVEANFLEEALKTAETDDQIACVGSLILLDDKETVYFDGNYNPAEQASGSVQQVEFANGAGMLVRLSVFEKSGGFDERFCCYLEEKEWCRRVQKEYGFTIFNSRESTIYHKREASDVSQNSTYYRMRNRFIPASTQAPVNFQSLLERVKNEPDKETRNTLFCALQDGQEQQFGKRKRFRPSLGFQIKILWMGIRNRLRRTRLKTWAAKFGWDFRKPFLLLLSNTSELYGPKRTHLRLVDLISEVSGISPTVNSRWSCE